MVTLLRRLAAWWRELVTPCPYSPETSPETVGAHIINPKPPKTPPPAGSAHALPPRNAAEFEVWLDQPPTDPKRTAKPDSVRLPLERGQPLRNPKPRVPPPDGYQPEGSGPQGAPPQGASGFVQANFPPQVTVTHHCPYCGKTWRDA